MLLTSWNGILREFFAAQTLWLGLLFLSTYPFVGSEQRAGRQQHGWSANLALIAHLLLVPITAALQLQGMADMARLTRFGYQLTALLIVVTILTRLLYQYLLPRLGLQPPRIVHDLSISSLTLLGFFGLAAQAGLNLTGVIATSAVVTAVIGLSLQDTLGNVMGGLVLQMDKSLRVGDWVKFGDISGRLVEISWRYTAIETRNWETVVVPNSQLMKSQVIVLGRRADPLLRWRRWVWFHVDFRYSPPEVIQLVNKALQSADIPCVADEPQPNCILMDFGDSTARYAVRYWLTDPAADDPTDSAVRTHLAYALRRAGIPMSIPTQALYVNQGDPSQRGLMTDAEIASRRQLLARTPLLRSLSEDERGQLAEKLISAPFLTGEVITRQGAEGHWLYLLAEGEVSIRLRNEAGHEAEVNRIQAVGFFGEMSLMTGEPRGSTVVALSDVLCYRLDKESFQEIIQRRPEIAEVIAQTLAERRAQTELASHLMAVDEHARHVAAHKHSILSSIQAFFRLEQPRL